MLTAARIAKIEAAAKGDAKLFVEEFGEALDPESTDWDSEAWAQETALAAETGGKGFSCYQRALVEETARLVSHE